MTKHVGAMVRWSFQLAIAAEQDHFEKRIHVQKNTPFSAHRRIKKKQNYIIFTKISAKSTFVQHQVLSDPILVVSCDFELVGARILHLYDTQIAE